MTVGVAAAAAFTSVQVAEKGVGIAAWVATAIIGTTATIAVTKHG